MVSWLLIISGLFLVATIFNYLKLISDSKNKINSLNYYLNLHAKHLNNIIKDNVDLRTANEIIIKRVIIRRLINQQSVLNHENYLNPTMVEYQFFDINDALESEKLLYAELFNPKYAIKKTLSIPSNFLNLLFPVKGMFKNSINFLFWIATVLMPLIKLTTKLIQSI
ncbi:hypothetical protein [Mammaliicoccus lentus]|uniref:hypothetical protein n=1 Tax=Mammaliicoccus lentus TaxID=42858 RepID=UPI001C4F5546|nr:hypothetical protein [Mammaliicoccus lentus]MBW0761377.1 hypothetical protein [Mammaliicoccus lentus]